MKKHIVLKSSVLSVLAGMSLVVSAVSADQVDVQILGINDFHGAIDQTSTAYMPDGKISGAGTATQLDAYMDKAQADFAQTSPNGTSFRVQAGDMVGASPANSGLLQDEPTVQIFNEMNVEYGTLGNHEFDEGLAEYNRIMTGTAPAPDSTINQITKDYPHVPSNQTIVISNVVDKKTGEIPYNWKPYAIKSIPINNTSVKVGIIGVVTTEIPDLVLKQNYEQYDFLDEAETIAKYAKELRTQNVNAIMILAHIPATTGKDGLVGDQMATIINKVNQIYPDNSIDIVFTGHNHVYANGTIGNTRIVQALAQGKAYADVRGTLDTDTQDFIAVPTGQVVAVAPGILTGTPEIQAIVNNANTIVARVTETKIGTAITNANISREVNSDKESALGNLITKAQLAIARESFPTVDFAITNNGGVRADLVVNSDQSITWGAAQAVQPFGNILQVVELTGQEIYDVLNEQYDEGEKYFLQMSGLRYIYTDSGSADPLNPYKVVKAYKTNGEEIDPNATYKVVINDFLYGGGDGFKTFKKGRLLGAINPDTEVFIKYIKDLEASNQKVSATISGVKTYATVTLETSKKKDSSGIHDLVNRVYRNREGKIIQTELVSDLFTPTRAPETATTKVRSLANNSYSLMYAKSENHIQNTDVKKKLPLTGSKERGSLLLSLAGVATLFATALAKKKEH
ncbi:surface-anchored 5'-nucleotidase [Streptococcus porcinus]|uniref:surface-anchored 5'-nucleotidase n=1 Tax=Streptococcus porcinus TaxID=1340 RepID=UPI0010CAC0E8|nr:bifunctional metallophosphatase/5'-nucleotidase [Streptococcus porcinus]VTS30550.1 surface-anchored 5'-nucleotidase [Streptococcus porcinus]